MRGQLISPKSILSLQAKGMVMTGHDFKSSSFNVVTMLILFLQNVSYSGFAVLKRTGWKTRCELFSFRLRRFHEFCKDILRRTYVGSIIDLNCEPHSFNRWWIQQRIWDGYHDLWVTAFFTNKCNRERRGSKSFFFVVPLTLFLLKKKYGSKALSWIFHQLKMPDF